MYRHRQFFYDVFLLSRLVSGQVGIRIIFVYKGFDQKFGNWRYPHVSFVKYLETGASQGYISTMNVSNLKLLLPNARFTAFTLSELVLEKLTWGWRKVVVKLFHRMVLTVISNTSCLPSEAFFFQFSRWYSPIPIKIIVTVIYIVTVTRKTLHLRSLTGFSIYL